MDSSIVIKVKYGETLRRFNARVVGKELELDMSRLREKILSLFNLALGTDLTLTYVDEDGDIVTLADEDDLSDVLKQHLNPLRITVKLNSEKGSRSFSKSSGNSTPMRSPRVQHPLQDLNTSVSEIFKSVPGPFREAVLKLSSELTSKASSSALVLSELVDLFYTMGQAYHNKFSESLARPEASTFDGMARNMGDPSADEGQHNSSLHMKHGTQFEPQNFECTPILLDPKFVEGTAEKGKVTEAVGSLGVSASDVLNADVKTSIKNKGKVACENVTEAATGAEKMKDSGKSIESLFGSECTPVGYGAYNPDYVSRCLKDAQKIEVGSTMVPKPTDSGSSSDWPSGMGSINECPFTGMPPGNDTFVRPFPYTPVMSPFKSSFSHGTGIGTIFHRGIRCDGCGVHPITGPRFKSKVKENYDLCSICFNGMGNEADYIRIDRPPRIRTPMLPHVLRGYGMKHARPKLDSRFIQDVNVPDGTIMGPFTPFTKIWRMRNNGTVVWPRGLQLQWIRGDRLGDVLSVEVEIPAEGLLPDKELDVAVDFTAPQLPGRYISYWRMASPSGQKFGQRVWVIIQVDASLKNSSEDLWGLNLNLPPVGGGVRGTEIINMNVDPTEYENFPELQSSNVPFADVQPVNHQGLNFPINNAVNNVSRLSNSENQGLKTFPIDNTSFVGSGTSTSTAYTPVPASSLIDYPVIDKFSEGSPYLSTPMQSPFGMKASEDFGGNKKEQTLLRELEDMGFKQIDLNKKVLRMNGYDLEQSVDDLVGVADWDPILEELQEMGFTDQKTNKKLLLKNNGSIKRVVMDLITGEHE